MPLQTADRLALAHQRELVRIAAGTQAAAAATARTATPADISGWWSGAADGLLARVSGGYAQARRASVEFLRRHAAAHGVTLDPVPASMDMTQARTSLRVTGPVAFKTSIAAGADVPHAMRSMSTQLQGSAQRLTMAGDRDTFEQTLLSGRGIIGWRRRLSGIKTCGFCAMLASRGAVYATRESATTAKDGLRFHDHCHCWAEPLYRHEAEPPYVRELQRQWRHVTAGETGEAKARAWRDHWENHVSPESRGRLGIAGTQTARVEQVFGEVRGRLAELGIPPVRRAIASGLPGFAPQAQPVRAALLRPKTARGVEQAWASEMRRITGRDIPVSIPADTSVLTAREYAEGVLRGLEAFPDAQLLRIEFVTGLDADEYAHVVGGVMRFNARLANEANRSLLTSSLRGDVAKWEDGVGWSTRGDGTTTSMAVHEFGHIVDDTLGGRIHTEALLRMDTLARQAGLDTDTWVAREISAYSGSDAHEMVAEAFADVLLRGDAASIASRRIFEVLEREYAAGGKRVGITPGITGRAVAQPNPFAGKTVAELRDLARQNGVTIPPLSARADIVRLLEAANVRPAAAAADLINLPSLARGGTLASRRARAELLARIEAEPGIAIGLSEDLDVLVSQGLVRSEAGRFVGETVAGRAQQTATRYFLTDQAKAEIAALRSGVAAPVPLARQSITQLRALARERGVTIPAGAKKADIVRLLEAPPKATARPIEGDAALRSLPIRDNNTLDALVSTRHGEAIVDYSNNGYQYVNAALRFTKGDLAKVTDAVPPGTRGIIPSEYSRQRVLDQVHGIDAAMAVSRTTRPIVVHRGVDRLDDVLGRRVTDRSLVGEQWTEDSYVSTTSAGRASAEFTGNRTGAEIRITVPEDVGAIGIDSVFAGLRGEREILLQRGLTFRVTGDRVVNGLRTLDVEVVPAAARLAEVPPLAKRPVAELRTLAKERGIPIPPRAPKAELVRLLQLPDAEVAKLRQAAVREAAKAKAAQIESATSTAKVLAEVDRLIAAKSEAKAIRAALTGADPAVRAALTAVADDPVKLRAALTRLGAKAKIKPVSRAGAKVKYDPDLMESAVEIKAGTQVTVVSRGASVTLPDGSVVQIAKAKVTPVSAKIALPARFARTKRISNEERIWWDTQATTRVIAKGDARRNWDEAMAFLRHGSPELALARLLEKVRPEQVFARKSTELVDALIARIQATL